MITVREEASGGRVQESVLEVLEVHKVSLPLLYFVNKKRIKQKIVAIDAEREKGLGKKNIMNFF